MFDIAGILLLKGIGKCKLEGTSPVAASLYSIHCRDVVPQDPLEGVVEL